MREMINISEYVSAELFDTMKRIRDLFPNAWFGGSLGLVVTGLLQREVKDLDVYIDFNPYDYYKLLEEDAQLKFEWGHSNADMCNLAVGVKVPNSTVKVDLFYVDKSRCHGTLVDLMVNHRVKETFQIQSVNYALMAKSAWAMKGITKHSDDLNTIRLNFNLPIIVQKQSHESSHDDLPF